MFSTKLLDFEQREEAYSKQSRQTNKPAAKDVEMCGVDSDNTTVTKISRLQKYLNLLDAQCQNLEKDKDAKKRKEIKKICIDVFTKIENEHNVLIAKNYNLVKSCKRELYLIVERIIEHFKRSPNTFEDYIFLFDLVKNSEVLKMHTTDYYKIWAMRYTQTQIDSLELVRQMALLTLKLSIKAEHDEGYRSKDKRIIPSIKKALDLDLFMLPLGNQVPTTSERELRAMQVGEEKKLGGRLIR